MQYFIYDMFKFKSKKQDFPANKTYEILNIRPRVGVYPLPPPFSQPEILKP